jgi:hypothetical protein
MLPLESAMNHPHRKHPFRAVPPVNRHTGQIEWEELPSLADSLKQRLVSRGTRHDFAESSSFPSSAHGTWSDVTMPASLEVSFEPEPFKESSIDGLATREVRDQDVFRHFFA